MYGVFWKIISLVIKADCAGRKRGIKFAEDSGGKRDSRVYWEEIVNVPVYYVEEFGLLTSQCYSVINFYFQINVLYYPSKDLAPNSLLLLWDHA